MSQNRMLTCSIFLFIFKTNLVLLLVLLFFDEVRCQSTFSYEYMNGYVGNAIRQNINGKFMSLGGTDYYYNWHFRNMSNLNTTKVFFLRTDETGQVELEKTYGRMNSRMIGKWFEQTNDNGYIIVGLYNTDLVWPPDSNNILLIKTDDNGSITWSKMYDTGEDDLGFCVQQTTDGGFIVSGFHDSDPISPIGTTWALLMKTDLNGNIEWAKEYQFAIRDFDTGEAFSYVVKQTADAGYVFVGTTNSSHQADVYVIRTDADGNLRWAKSYDDIGNRLSVGMDVIETSAGNFMIAGSMDKDRMAGKVNYPYVLHIDALGNFIKARIYERVQDEGFPTGFSSVQQTVDGGFVFCGKGGYGDAGEQMNVLKTDADVNIEWTRVYTNMDGVNVVGSRCGRQTSDGGYVFTGRKGWDRAALLKTDALGLIACKIPEALIEILPDVVVRNWNPNVILSGILPTDIILTTQNLFEPINTICDLVLPIDLIHFTGKNQGEVNVLEWSTPMQTDDTYFVIERNESGDTYAEIGTVNDSFSQENTFSTYRFTDENPLIGTNYYRLKTITSEGIVQYSEIVEVSGSDSGTLRIVSFYPNPAHDYTYIFFHAPTDSRDITLLIYNSMGQIVLRKTLCYSTFKLNKDKIEWNKIESGIYFVKLYNHEKSEIQKIVILK